MTKLGSKRPKPSPPEPFRHRDIADIEADLCRAMQAAANERRNADDCLAPQGVGHHHAAAVRWDHLAVSYRDELSAAKAAQ